MKHLSIAKPCTENWNEMTPTQKGAFCQKCCKQVIDFTNKTPDEIRKTLLERKNQEVCGRIEESQLDRLNHDFEAWRSNQSWSMQRASFYAFLFVFGLSIVSCSHQEDEKQIELIQEQAQKIIHAAPQEEIKGEAIPEPEVPQHIPEPEILEIVDVQEEMKVVECFGPNVRVVTHTMGAMVPTRVYEKYLEEVVPEEPKRDANGKLIPTEFNAIAFPNPTNGSTTLKFEVPESTTASFEIYSVTGQRIQAFGAENYEPGTYEIPFDLSNEKPGTYIIAVISGNYTSTVKVMKL